LQCVATLVGAEASEVSQAANPNPNPSQNPDPDPNPNQVSAALCTRQLVTRDDIITVLLSTESNPNP